MAKKFTLLSEFATILSTIKARSWRSAVLLPFIAAFLSAATGTATQTLSAQINAISKVSVPSTLTVANAGTTFVGYAGNLAVSYRARTTASTGSGSLTVKANADFSPAGGPSIANGHLTYTCSSATLGTACSGTQTASTTSQTNVITVGASVCTGGGGSCSSVDPNSVQTSFTLTNTPSFQTGSYSATLTFTASAI
jgi:hypothetical protein